MKLLNGVVGNNNNEKTYEQCKLILRKLFFIVVLYVVSILCLIAEIFAWTDLRYISSNVYLGTLCILFFLVLNLSIYIIALIITYKSIKHGRKVVGYSDKFKEYLEYRSILPMFGFIISLAPSCLWLSTLAFHKDIIIYFTVLYTILFLSLMLMAIFWIKYVRIYIYALYTNGLMVWVIIVNLCLLSINWNIDFAFKNNYTAQVNMSDFISTSGQSEEIKYHTSSVLSSYTDCRVHAIDEKKVGYFINYTILECNYENLRIELRNRNYKFSKHYLLTQDPKTSVCIYSVPSTIKDWNNYYIENGDQIITIETNLSLAEDKLQTLCNTLMAN